jgi:hypothetical protein
MNAALDFRMARIVISAVQDVYEGYSASFPLVEQVLTPANSSRLAPHEYHRLGQ